MILPISVCAAQQPPAADLDSLYPWRRLVAAASAVCSQCCQQQLSCLASGNKISGVTPDYVFSVGSEDSCHVI